MNVQGVCLGGGVALWAGHTADCCASTAILFVCSIRRDAAATKVGATYFTIVFAVVTSNIKCAEGRN